MLHIKLLPQFNSLICVTILLSGMISSGCTTQMYDGVERIDSELATLTFGSLNVHRVGSIKPKPFAFIEMGEVKVLPGQHRIVASLSNSNYDSKPTSSCIEVEAGKSYGLIPKLDFSDRTWKIEYFEKIDDGETSHFLASC